MGQGDTGVLGCGRVIEPAIVHFRQKCVNHPPRGCPLKVLTVDVVGLPVVKAAILHYVATFE